MEENIKLLQPPDKWYSSDEPIIFLAGSIHNQDNIWQNSAIASLHKLMPELLIANPYNDKWETAKANIADYTKQQYQIEWELAHIRIASATGGILFWLNKDAGNKEMWELAEWLQNWKYRKNTTPSNKIKLAIGIDDECPMREYIIHRIFNDCSGLTIATTLEEAAKLMYDLLKGEVK